MLLYKVLKTNIYTTIQKALPNKNIVYLCKMSEKLSFVTVNDGSESRLMPFVKEVLSKHIVPINGSEQTLALIQNSDDWRCEVLLTTSDPESAPPPVPRALIAYKLQPTDRHSSFGLNKSVEVNALWLVDPLKSRGKGYRSALLSRVVKYARSIGSDTVHVTVHDIEKDTRNFFRDKGFIEMGVLSSPHCESTERLYSLTLSKKGTRACEETKGLPPRKISQETLASLSDPHSQKHRRDDPEAKIAASSDSLPRIPRKRQREDDSETDVPRSHDSRPPKRPREDSARIFSSSMSGGFQTKKTSGRQWKLPLRQPYLQWIKEGKKTVEGRINSGLPAKFRPGDEVTFFGGPNSVRTQVLQVDSFKSFQDMLQATTVGKCLPDYAHRSVDDAVRLYRSFPGYADKERQYGVLAIYITCLP